MKGACKIDKKKNTVASLEKSSLREEASLPFFRPQLIPICWYMFCTCDEYFETPWNKKRELKMNDALVLCQFFYGFTHLECQQSKKYDNFLANVIPIYSI